MMTEEAEELAFGLDMEVKHAGEGRSPKSSKKWRSVAVLPVIPEGEEESYFKDLAEPEGQDAPMSHDAQEEKVGGDHTSPEDCCSADVPAELSNVARGRIPPSLRVQASLLLTGGGDAIRGGRVSISSPADAPPVSKMPALAVGPDPFPRSPEEINTDIKHQLMKEIRQFGRKYEKIFRLLEEVQGPLEVRKQFVEFTIKEAARFKKRDLIKRLEKILENIVSDHLLSFGKPTPNM